MKKILNDLMTSTGEADIGIDKGKTFLGFDFGLSKVVVISETGKKKILESLPKSYQALFLHETIGVYEQSHYFQNHINGDLGAVFYQEIESVIKEAVESVLDLCVSCIPLAVISFSGGLSSQGKGLLQKSLEKYLRVLEFIPSPLAVVYSLGMPGHCIVVDIGINTIDFCRFYGAMPEKKDYALSFKAGNFIDTTFQALLKKRFGKELVSTHVVTQWKERYGTVAETRKKLLIKFKMDNKICYEDIAPELQKSCTAIVPEIIEQIKELMVSCQPDFEAELENNIYLTGRGAFIAGLSDKIRQEYEAKYNPVSINFISDPVYAPAIGALAMARDNIIGQ